MHRLNGGEIQISEVTTTTPSPFAANLLFGYVAEFIYQSDAPLAERRASVLALDSELLRNLLGQGDPTELLDPRINQQLEDELQRRVAERQAKGKEGVYDLLRELGPMNLQALNARHVASTAEIENYLAQLAEEKRIFSTDIRGTHQYANMEDAATLRDALGIKLPTDITDSLLHHVKAPYGIYCSALSIPIPCSALNN